jgi:catechol 2,3-dioxygenase-like lactoylglutathione lyase family enzyme
VTDTGFHHLSVPEATMIRKLSHVTLFVLDQKEALDFYTKKLGFEVRTDVTMDEFRWLTLGPKDQPDLEIVLMPIQSGHMWDEETTNQVRQLVKKGALGGGVFNTDDCRKTYAELKSKGVEFLSEPEEKPYGIEAVFKDNSGYWFSLTQHR